MNRDTELMTYSDDFIMHMLIEFLKLSDRRDHNGGTIRRAIRMYRHEALARGLIDKNCNLIEKKT